MAKSALGTHALLRLGFETTYDTAPAAAKFKKFLFSSFGLSGKAALETDFQLGTGTRDTQDYFKDRLMVDGDLQQSMEIAELGYLLTALLGTPTTTTEGSDYKHVFTSGGADILSFFAELGHPNLDTAEYHRYGGIKIDAMAVEMGDSGPAKAVYTLKARSEVIAATSKAPSATYFALAPKYFTKRKGYIEIGGSAVAKLTGGNFSFGNGLEVIETIAADGLIAGIDEGVASANGNMTVRYQGQGSLETASANETPVDLVYGYETADGTATCEFRFPKAYLPDPEIGIDGPGGIEVSYEWQASGGSEAMMIVTLINKTTSYAL